MPSVRGKGDGIGTASRENRIQGWTLLGSVEQPVCRRRPPYFMASELIFSHRIPRSTLGGI